MSLNTLGEQKIYKLIDTLGQRVDSLQSKLQGAQIDSVKIGNAIITTAKIEDGSISNGKIVDGAVTDAKINNLSADKINAGTINADRIGVNTITADKLNVGNLSSISASLGTVTAGSVTGITITASVIKTSSGNNRISLTGDQFQTWENGTLRVLIKGGDDAAFFGGEVAFIELGGSTLRGTWGPDQESGEMIYGSDNVPLMLFQILGTGNIIAETADGDIDIFCDTFQINGSNKTAIVPTKDGYKALYCVESPEVWFFDIVNDLKNIDPLFLEVTEGELKTITNENSDILVFRKRKGYANIRLESKSKNEFLINNKFWNEKK